MGSFSWLRADTKTNRINIALSDSFACLVPKPFSSGVILDKYQDYGHLGHKSDGSPRYDMYELLAFWNKDIPYEDKTVGDYLKYDDTADVNLKEIDQYTDHNRDIGIDIGCSNFDIEKLKYPLKLVSVSYARNHTYEMCQNRSFNDYTQGSYPLTWLMFVNEYKPKYLHEGIYQLLHEKYAKTKDAKLKSELGKYLSAYKDKLINAEIQDTIYTLNTIFG